MRRALVAGNWKMNGARDFAAALVDDLKPRLAGLNDVEAAICPPFTLLGQLAGLLEGSDIALGAQDVSNQSEGAYTGEVSGAMLREAGCRYVIIGHSERRDYHGETDAQVAAKLEQAQAAGLIPILCVGEQQDQRESGQTEAVVGGQVDAVLDAVGVAAFGRAVIAYEPVWAIGTGLTATPEQAQEVHAMIRARVASRDAGVAEGLRILYGGSMKPGNAPELLAMTDIDGGLIGGASLKADDFSEICKAADQAGRE